MENTSRRSLLQTEKTFDILFRRDKKNEQVEAKLPLYHSMLTYLGSERTFIGKSIRGYFVVKKMKNCFDFKIQWSQTLYNQTPGVTDELS